MTGQRIWVSRAGALAAVLCVTGAALGAASPAAWAAAVPRPYQPAEDAKKVSGASSSADAPELASGLFTDRIKPGEEKYYSLDLDAKSDVHIAATAAPEPGTRVTFQDGLKVTLQNTDGDSCGEGEADGDGNTAFPLSAYAARLVGKTSADESCRAKGPYLVHVVREEGNNSDPSSWPLELSVMKEPGLKGSIPAPAPGSEAETDDANTRPSTPSGTARTRKGGTGFNDARAVGSGVWKDRLRPGETRWFRVPVDWNQRLYARMEVPNAARDDDDGPRFLADGFRMNLYNPARGGLYREDFQSYDGDGANFDRYTNPVRYENRFLEDESEEASQTRFAGWYYVAVIAGPDMVKPLPKSVPVTLRIAVTGKEKGGPAYDGDAAAAGFGVDDQDREMAEKGLTEAQVESNATLRTFGWVGVGAGSALLVLLASWLVLARRRAAGTTPHGAPAPLYTSLPYGTTPPGTWTPQGPGHSGG
jgi:hypothetical protein